MKRAFTCLLLGVLVSCASNSGVFRVGENKYEVSTRATWEFGGRVGAIGYAMHDTRSHDAVIRVYDDGGNVIETHEHKGEFKEC
jgi:hypothetical protein